MKENNKKPNLAPGLHRLMVQSIKFSGRRVSIIHQSLEHQGFKGVVRSFTQGDASLAKYLERVTGSRRLFLNEADTPDLVGRLILALLKPAKNPEYIDLAKVIRVLTPDEMGMSDPNINAPRPVTDRRPG